MLDNLSINKKLKQESDINQKELIKQTKQVNIKKYLNSEEKLKFLIGVNSNIKRKKYYSKLKTKEVYFQEKCKILGGGCGTSKFRIENPEKIEYNKKKITLDKKFIEDYKYYTNKDHVLENINEEKQGPMLMEIFQQCISLREIHIRRDILAYKPKLMELIDVYFIYVLTGFSQKEVLKQKEIDKLGQFILDMKQSFDMEALDQPSLDLSFYFDILYKFNSNKVGKDEQNKSQFIKLAEFLSKIVKHGASVVEAVGGNFMEGIKLALEGTQALLQQYQKSKTNQLFSYLLNIWVKKTAQFEDRLWNLTLAEELEFYIKLFCEQCINQDQESELILITLIKIEYYLCLVLDGENKQLPLNCELIRKFLPKLIQKGNSQNLVEEIGIEQFLIFTIQNPTFRFLSISIVLKYNEIISDAKEFEDYKEYITTYLCYKYLCEKKKKVKLAYETNLQFIEQFNKRIEDKHFQEKIMDMSKKRRQNLQLIPNLEVYEDKIDNSDDIHRMIANNLIEKWERDVRKRQQENIAQKDDVLLEVKDLYIQQQITYLEGNKIFQDKTQQRFSQNQQNQELGGKQQSNALKLIIDKFLNQDQTENKCKILGILAEGGTGKSMLIKKLETHLIESVNSSTPSEDVVEFIPLLIKCNSLDPVQPSIEQYLSLQGIQQKQIDIIKKSDRNKVILLDGYDEFSGEYFKIYSKLNLQSWKNTQVIVSSRREKLELSDACVNFSIENEQGERDETSFSIVKLEEFNKQDISDYCQRYFKQQRTNNEQLNEQQYSKDLTAIDECMKNQQLESLLYLPINLYLFSRMIVQIKDQSEIQQIQQSISDQIGIQEMFFKEQFKREAQDFIHTQFDNEKRNNDSLSLIINSYFEYFQEVAMQMFINKGKQGVVNFLQIQKDRIQFQLGSTLKKNLSEKQQQNILEKIIHYINSKIITRAKEVNIGSKNEKENKRQVVEFKHKSLFEYFVARAMKNDFDTHSNNINKLSMDELKNFKINKKLIMNRGQNQSEQQILIKLYKLMKIEIESDEFQSNYSESQIEKNSRYIQYLKRSKIDKITEISDIDIGSSNLISALFISKFSYSQLSLNYCSFSKAYLFSPKSNAVNFNNCNLENAYLKNTQINYDSCNTKFSSFDAFQKVFDTSSVYSFNYAILGKNNNLYSVTQAGFINEFQVANQSIQLLKSKQLSQNPLIQCLSMNNDDNILVASQYTLLLINSTSFDVLETYKFAYIISQILLTQESIIVTLNNETIHQGNFKSGFKMLNMSGQGTAYSQSNQMFVTYQNKSFTMWDSSKNFEMVKTISIDAEIKTAAFSINGNYLATGDNNSICRIWNVDKGLEIKKAIQGHNAALNTVAFSPDGKYLTTGGDDCTCRLWDVQKDFEIINTIYKHGFCVNSVVFSQDGKRFASCSQDNTCNVWNVEKNFELINTIQGITSNIYSTAFSSNGKYFVAGSTDSKFNIWNAEKNFELVNTIQGHDQTISSVTFSANCKYLATGSYDRSCKIWDVESGFKLIKTIDGNFNRVNSVAFSSDCKYLAIGYHANPCKIFNIEKGFEIINVNLEHSSIESIDFSADSKHLATGSQDGTCKIWNAEKGFELIVTFQGHNQSINSISFSLDGKYLATCSSDQTYKIWNPEKGFKLVKTIKAHTNKVNSIAFSSDSQLLATSSDDQTCKIWDSEKGFELINTIQNHLNIVQSVTFSGNNKYLATSSFDKTCKIWSIDYGFEDINSISGHTDCINDLAFSANSKYLVTGSSDHTFKIWNSEKGFELIKSIPGHTSNIESVAFSVDGKYIATGSNDCNCKIWNTQNGFELVHTLTGHMQQINSIQFSSDGKYLATGSEDNLCKIWNVQNNFSNIRTLPFTTSSINSVAFSADCKYFATGYLNKICKIWNVEKAFELITTLEGIEGSVRSVVFSPNNKYLATSSTDKTCKIWNLEKNFELIHQISGHTTTVSSASFSPNRKYLATVSFDKTCKIWNVDKGFELTYTIQAHTRNIFSVAFSSNGKYLATGSFDNMCKIWNVEKDFEEINTIQDHILNKYIC